MIAHGKEDPGGPNPEQLAAYVDGELSPATRVEVEAWLANHPDAAAEVAAMRHLSQLWQATTPPEPGEAHWDRVLAGVEARLSAAPAARPASWRLVWGVAAAAALAATVLLAVWLYQPPQAPSVPRIEPLPVVSSDDVEIISINGADTRALVVGEPPLREALALLTHGEVSVDDVKSEAHDMDPRWMREGLASPMVIVVPRDEEP